MIQEPRRTFGNIISSKKFFVHVVYIVVCSLILIINAMQRLWTAFYALNVHALKGLLLANFLGFYASLCLTISWVLVDDISWLGKAIILFVVGIIMTIVGAYFTIKFLDYGAAYYKNTSSVTMTNITVEYTHWLPTIGAVNFIEGVCTLLVFIYVILKCDS